MSDWKIEKYTPVSPGSKSALTVTFLPNGATARGVMGEDLPLMEHEAVKELQTRIQIQEDLTDAL